ncbi:o-succinylbenzoate synthase [Acidobacteria bacterium AH-259-D05]|nr:o-succinylbenzoate synthase [Acidobacteria bacterium AH-259-D05]
MKINQILLREVRLPLAAAFESSVRRRQERRLLLVEVRSRGVEGWGECVAGEEPFYTDETVDTAWLILTQLILPRIVKWSFNSPTEFCQLFGSIRGHRMAKSCVEAALWDLQARESHLPLWKLWGGTREKIPCGVSIGIQESPDVLIEKIEKEVQAGYHKIKIKIKPGWDLEIVSLVRSHFPDVSLMVDANGAYSREDFQHLKKLDEFDLLMIEQPLHYDDLLEHSKLQAQITTPICLDESIRHARDAAHACELQSCQIINIKMGRVGGPSEAKRVHDVCQERGVPVWCGGMLETGIGRAHNIALSTLENFTIPGDISASKRYYERDTICPPVEVTADGYIIAPQSPGLGYQPDRQWIDELTAQKKEFA